MSTPNLPLAALARYLRGRSGTAIISLSFIKGHEACACYADNSFNQATQKRQIRGYRMASTNFIDNAAGAQAHALVGQMRLQIRGRTVRDIVENDPAQVSDDWCRQTLRQLLELLDLQYAIGMPHGAITADTVVVSETGETLLLSPGTGNIPDICSDICALAGMVHYAITREHSPAAPLQGRLLKGFSKSLLRAVDRSMAPVHADRPRNFDEMRILLGIPVPRAHSQAIPAWLAETLQDAREDMARSLRHLQIQLQLLRRRDQAFVAGIAVVTGAAAALTLATNGDFSGREVEQRGSAPSTVADPPMTHAPAGPEAPGDALSLVPVTPDTDPENALKRPRSVASERPAARPPELAVKRRPNRPSSKAGGKAVAAAAAATAHPPLARDANSAQQNADAGTVAQAVSAPLPQLAVASSGHPVNLMIRPWGMVYVDGAARGASPPIKRLIVAPGRHSLLVTNPHAVGRTLEFDSSKGGVTIAIDFNREP